MHDRSNTVTLAQAEIVSSTLQYRGWASLLLANVRLGDGRMVARVIEDHGNAACVLPYDPQRHVALLVRQLRAPTLYAAGVATLIEVPAGLVDKGEDGATAATREAMEEVGLRLTALEPVASVWTMPGVSTERMSLFLGAFTHADKVAQGGGVATEHEDIEVIELPLAKLAAMADQGELTDLKTFTLVQTLRVKRPELFG